MCEWVILISSLDRWSGRSGFRKPGRPSSTRNLLSGQIEKIYSAAFATQRDPARCNRTTSRGILREDIPPQRRCFVAFSRLPQQDNTTLQRGKCCVGKRLVDTPICWQVFALKFISTFLLKGIASIYLHGM
jgi:hypothetical protein